jgi:hypothetical protein
MQLLLRAYGTDSLGDPGPVTHVIVELDPREVLDLRARLADVLSLCDLCAVAFFHDALRVAECDFWDEGPAWWDEDAEYQELPADCRPPESKVQVTILTINYQPDGVHWEFRQVCPDIRYETATVPWSFFHSAARQPGATHGNHSIFDTHRPRHR